MNARLYNLDAPLALAAGSGLGKLLESHRATLTRQADALIGPSLRKRMSSSDLVQETFMSASANISDFRGTTDAELLNWLNEVLRSRLVDGVRRHRLAESRRQAREVSYLPQRLADRKSTPAEEVAVRDEAAALLAALDRLPTTLQSVVRLRYIEELTFEQISERLDISVSTVWRQWAEAVEKLKYKLTPHHPK